jgi:hypothetical protein
MTLPRVLTNVKIKRRQEGPHAWSRAGRHPARPALPARPHHTGPGGYVQITEYSASTGKPLLHEDRFSASIGWQNVLWTSPDGSALVISDPRGAKDRYGGRSNILGVLANNRFTPIPHAADNSQFLAW